MLANSAPGVEEEILQAIPELCVFRFCSQVFATRLGCGQRPIRYSRLPSERSSEGVRPWPFWERNRAECGLASKRRSNASAICALCEALRFAST